jgi:hypothetical protein
LKQKSLQNKTLKGKKKRKEKRERKNTKQYQQDTSICQEKASV